MPAASSARVSDSSCGITLVCPTTAMKLASPPQRGTTCWCRWSASEPPATVPRFRPTLNACGAATRFDRPHRVLGERHQLGRLGRRQVLQLGDVPVGQHHQVAGVVRVQVQHRVHRRRRAPRPARPRRAAPGSGRTGSPSSDAGLLDVGQPVRRPQPAEAVRRADPVARLQRRLGPLGAVGHGAILGWAGRTSDGVGQGAAGGRSAVGLSLRRLATQAAICRRPPRPPARRCAGVPSRNRKVTAPASTSRAPASSRNGTFCQRVGADLLLHPVVAGVDLDPDPARRSCAATSRR